MDENLFAHQNQQFAFDLNEEQSSFGDFMNEEQLSNVDDPASNHVDWDNIEVEELMKPYEKFVAPSIVAEPPLDIDWSSHFTKQLVFDTRDALKQWIAEFGQKHNMSLVVKKSDYRDKRNPRIIFSCHRSGVYRPRAKKGSGENLKKRDTGTTKCECPFEVKFVKMFGVDDGWQFDSVKCGRHNHQLSSYLHGHHVHARLKPGEEEMLADFISAGIKPKQALSIIKRKDPSNTSSLQTVYNAKKKLIKASREGRTEFQQIGKEGADEGWIIRDRRDYLTDFPIDYLFAHPDSISLAKCFPHVFVMDCTYKTNQYGWPLFEIVGVASTGQTFPVCYCFMQNETTDHYLWALGCFKELLGDGEVPSAIVTDKDQACMSAVQAVFPDSYHLLCRWHILKGVEKKGKQCLPNEEDEKKDKKEGKEEEIHIPFGIERKKGWQAKLKEKWLECWNEIVWSKTLEAYEENLATLQQEFIQWPQLYEYVLTWLEFKEKFVSVWTDRVFHIGNTSSNRVEGAHNTLKSSLLRSRRHTFLTMFHLIKNSMTILVSEIKKQFTMSLNLQSHTISIPFFKNIKGSVSSECTKILVAEYEKSTKGITPETGCNCALQVTSGLPCACKITALERGGKRLELYDVHDFWKKLCIIPRRVDFDELEMHEDFQLWVATYRKSSSEYKKYMLRRLREDALKETTWLNTPVEIPNVKGRPPSSKEPKQKKVDHSTRREPSAFEREDPEIPIAPPGIYYSLGSQHSNTNSGRLSVKNPSSKQKIKRAKTSTSVMEFYKGNLPTGYEHHVKDITQVKGDGNCGFRAVAVGLGMDEDIGWVKVREDCVKELDKNFNLYSTICGGPDHAAVLRNRINHYQSPCTENDRYWMIMPETGFLLANAYRKIVVYMAKREYVTFFQSFVPMMEPPPLEPRNPDFHMICILWTPGHYVPVQLHPNSPIPSATYFCLKYGSAGMLGWNEMIHERSMLFELLYPDRFGTRGKEVEEFILSDEDYNDKMA